MWRHLIVGLSVALLAVSGLAAELPQTLTPVAKRPAATNYVAEDLDGKTQRLSDYRGKVVLVNFWATDCPVCVKEMPEMVKTYNKYHARGLEFIAVAMQYDPPNYVIDYAGKHALPFKVALDPMGELAKAFGDVKLTPTTFIIDKRGDIVSRILGEPDFARLRELLEKKLAEPA